MPSSTDNSSVGAVTGEKRFGYVFNENNIKPSPDTQTDALN